MDDCLVMQHVLTLTRVGIVPQLKFLKSIKKDEGKKKSERKH